MEWWTDGDIWTLLTASLAKPPPSLVDMPDRGRSSPRRSRPTWRSSFDQPTSGKRTRISARQAVIAARTHAAQDE
jgi:plasmid stabilization system protein ParE